MFPINDRAGDADRQYQQAVELLRSGDLSGASTLLTRITHANPKHAKAWMELGKILLTHLDDAEYAADCFKKAVDAAPTMSHAYLAYADALFRLERFAEMNAVLNQAREVKGIRRDLVFERFALLMESQGRYDEAIEHFRKALLESFSDEDIVRCEKGIGRCNIKKRYS